VILHPDGDLLSRAAASRLLLTLLDAQSLHAPVHVALTGGSIGIAVLAAMARDPLRDLVSWEDVHLWWGDERFLPTGHSDRNETQAREALLDHVPVREEHIHATPGPDLVPDAATAARQYSAHLTTHAAPGSSLPQFSVVLLGVGPDGHVASLFPHRPAVAEDDVAAVAELESPKPPPQRVSLTLPTLNSGTQVWLMVSGAEKAPAVTAALTGRDVREESEVVEGPVVPAGRVRGRAATLWLLDVAAAADLPS